MKLTESKLRQLIRESVMEYRFMRDDGDVTEPVNKIPYSKKSDDAKKFEIGFGKKGKRRKGHESTVLSTGKGKELYKIISEFRYLLDSKIDWTEDEKKDIEDIIKSICNLALKTKRNGNKKRGYYGDDED